MHRLLITLLSISYVVASDQPLKSGTFNVKVPGGELSYLVSGDGPPLMVLPNSWGIEKEALQAMFSDLEKMFQIIYFDIRGMGDSSPIPDRQAYSITQVREDANYLKRHLGLQKMYVLGWSAGAMNGLVYAGENSDQLHGVILVHGISYIDPAEVVEFSKGHEAFFKRRMEVITDLVEGSGDKNAKNEKVKRFIIDEWFPYLCGDREGGKALIADVLGKYAYSWPHMQSMMEDFENFDARPMLPKIKCPALVIAGGKDLIPPQFIKRDAQAMPHSTFVNFESSGHFAMMEDRAAFNKAVKDWFLTTQTN